MSLSPQSPQAFACLDPAPTPPFPSSHHHTVVCAYGLCIYVLWLIPSTSFFQFHSPLPLWQLSVCSACPCLFLFGSSVYFVLLDSTHEICPEGIHPCNMKNRDIYWRYKIQETLYIGTDASVTYTVGTLGPHTVLPITISCPITFSWNSSIVWNLFPFKWFLVLGKARNCRVPNLGYGGGGGRPLSPLGNLMFDQKTLHKTWYMGRCIAEWSCRSPVTIAMAFWII